MTFFLTVGETKTPSTTVTPMTAPKVNWQPSPDRRIRGDAQPPTATTVNNLGCDHWLTCRSFDLGGQLLHFFRIQPFALLFQA